MEVYEDTLTAYVEMIEVLQPSFEKWRLGGSAWEHESKYYFEVNKRSAQLQKMLDHLVRDGYSIPDDYRWRELKSTFKIFTYNVYRRNSLSYSSETIAAALRVVSATKSDLLQIHADRQKKESQISAGVNLQQGPNKKNVPQFRSLREVRQTELERKKVESSPSALVTIVVVTAVIGISLGIATFFTLKYFAAVVHWFAPKAEHDSGYAAGAIATFLAIATLISAPILYGLDKHRKK